MKTNKQVLDALTHCINKRWKLLAQGAREYSVLDCALCDLFDGCNFVRNNKLTPSTNCKGCPVYLHNKGKGCAAGSLYIEFNKHSSILNAKKMLNSLKDARKHFFGEIK
jgi:hypothetical protein